MVLFVPILACDVNFGISKEGKIPWWPLKKDLDFFKSKTDDQIIVVGKNTWINDFKSKPLKSKKFTYIISSSLPEEEITKFSNVKLFRSTNELELYCQKHHHEDDCIFICGGASLYDHFINTNLAQNVYVTIVKKDYKTDNFVKLNHCGSYEILENDSEMCILKFTQDLRITNYGYHWEEQYLRIMSELYHSGHIKTDTRNGKVKSLFNRTISISLKNDGFPLVSTKKLFWRGVVEELLFFIRGDTDAHKLSAKNVKIWDGNTTREFLDQRGLNDYEEGDMGPMYGWNWRHFGAKYNGKSNPINNEDDGGFDQLKNVIELIKNDPSSRRIMMTAFDPSKVSESVLAPCHSIIIQFYVHHGELDMFMYQRSADFFHGVPFNITSSALLLYLIAHVTNLKPNNLHITFGDLHIYDQHNDAVKEQLQRKPICNQNNKLILTKQCETVEDLEKLEYRDFVLCGYQSHPSITAPFVV